MESGPRLGRLVIGAVIFLGFAGAAWYIAFLQAENTRLQSGPRAAPTVVARVAAEGDRTLTAEQRDQMLQTLRAELGEERNVWFSTVPNDPEATSFRMTLQTVFEEAGWQVRGNSTVGFAMKPGLYFFAAEEEPVAYVAGAAKALENANLAVTIGRGYREFYNEKKKENPNWRGFDMAPEQAFVIVVGSKPKT